MSPAPLAIAGYASLFATPDAVGDVVRSGAFRASLARAPRPPMLLRHDPRLAVGHWLEAREDARGLRVRGEIAPDAPAGALARRLIAHGLDGLSIGYRALRWLALPSGGRELLEIELLEVSLVETPMLPRARFAPVAGRAP